LIIVFLIFFLPGGLLRSTLFKQFKQRILTKDPQESKP